jgi:hypothetical protein
MPATKLITPNTPAYEIANHGILSHKDPILAIQNKQLCESLSRKTAWTESKFFQRYNELRARRLVEATLEGNISDETPSVAATLELLNMIIMGAEAHVPLDFARIFTTTQATMKIPVGTYGTFSAITAGAFTDSPKTEAEVDIALDTEYGVLVSWTRAHLEDATWDVMAEQIQGAGYAIQAGLCGLLVAALLGAGGATHVGVITDYTDWTDWVKFMSAVDVAKYGPADYCLVSPAHYWGLLALDQFVNALYAGSDEVMRTGVAKTMLGMTFLRVEGMTVPVVLNSKKAIALAYRRQLTVEPYEHPETNKYGFVASVRAKEKMLMPLAAGEASA